MATSKFKTSITLPADPINPLEAATKQYIDNLLGPVPVVVNPKTSDYTLLITDISSAIVISSSSLTTLTIPTNASVAFDIGTQIILGQGSTGAVTIAGSAGVTVTSASTSLTTVGIGSTVFLLKVAINTWYATGDLSAFGSSIIIQDTPPSSPTNGLQWIDTSSGIFYVWFNDGSSSQWVQFGVASATLTTGGGGGGVALGNVFAVSSLRI